MLVVRALFHLEMNKLSFGENFDYRNLKICLKYNKNTSWAVKLLMKPVTADTAYSRKREAQI